jgi:hypothetical protein
VFFHLGELLGTLPVLAPEAEREARVDDRAELHVLRPKLLRDREVLVAADVRAEVLLLEEAVLPVARELPPGVDQDLVREDDERVARLVVERLQARVAPHRGGLLPEDLVEVGRHVLDVGADALPHLLPERRQEEELLRRDLEELGRVVHLSSRAW